MTPTQNELIDKVALARARKYGDAEPFHYWEKMAKAAIEAMGDATIRKDVGCTGTTVQRSGQSSLNSPSIATSASVDTDSPANQTSDNQSFPLGAIENGRVFIERLNAGIAQDDSDLQELIRMQYGINTYDLYKLFLRRI